MWYLYRPDAVSVWRDEEVRKRLNWYYQVMNNQKPAKYLICKRIPIDIKLEDSSERELWEEHERAAETFKKTWIKVKSGELSLSDLEKPGKNFLDLKIELVKRIITHCHLCERRCEVNRESGEKGFCRLDDRAYLASYFHHMGEEAPLVPSSTLFFVSCNFRCVFCQNWDISQEWGTSREVSGLEVTPQLMAIIIEELRKKGGRNTNFVGGDPTPSMHVIIEALKYTDVNVPMLWNSNFYMSVEATKILIDVIDIGLPDFKYYSDECALKLSNVPNYFKVVSRNHLIFHEEGVDTIVRHLVLPNHLDCCTKPILEWLAKNCPNFLINIMDQYRPEYLVSRNPLKYREISRRLTTSEISEAYRCADKLGLIWRPVS